MRSLQLSLLAVLLVGCGRYTAPTNCGMHVGGDINDRLKPSLLTNGMLQIQIDKALDAASFTTSPVFMDQTENCKAMQGFVVYTRPESGWIDDWGRHISGYTQCWAKVIVTNTPNDRDWTHSAIIHELFHVMQNCKAELPVDTGMDADHADWLRHGIYPAIERQQ